MFETSNKSLLDNSRVEEVSSSKEKTVGVAASATSSVQQLCKMLTEPLTASASGSTDVHNTGSSVDIADYGSSVDDVTAVPSNSPKVQKSSETVNLTTGLEPALPELKDQPSSQSLQEAEKSDLAQADDQGNKAESRESITWHMAYSQGILSLKKNYKEDPVYREAEKVLGEDLMKKIMREGRFVIFRSSYKDRTLLMVDGTLEPKPSDLRYDQKFDFKVKIEKIKPTCIAYERISGLIVNLIMYEDVDQGHDPDVTNDPNSQANNPNPQANGPNCPG